MSRMLSHNPPLAAPRKRPGFVNPPYTLPSQQPFGAPPGAGFLPEETSPLRKLAFMAALAMVWIRFSIVPEVLVALTGANTYLLFLVGPPAILGCLITGGLGRAFRATPVRLWTGYYIWMLLGSPFSSWVGASAMKSFGYMRTDLICLYIVAGLVVTWDEAVKMIKALGVSGLITLVVAKIWAKPDTVGRLSLEMGFDGILANSNDLSAHLVLLLPFVIYLICNPGRNFILRLLMAGGVFYGLWVILGTSSRGAMVGLFAVALFLFYRASGAQRIAVMVAVPILAAGLISVLPKANLVRLATLFGGESMKTGDDDEAGESMASRQYLVQQSIKYSLEHPVFGIGVGQFSNFEGLTSKAAGKQGNWHETHNTYTQISSECGMPALLMALGAFVSMFGMVSKTHRMARQRKDGEVSQVCLWFLVSVAGYMVTLTFLACAYRFTLPAMLGLGVAIHYAAQRRFQLQDAAARLVPA